LLKLATKTFFQSFAYKVFSVKKKMFKAFLLDWPYCNTNQICNEKLVSNLKTDFKLHKKAAKF
jgi:hypothetical protein